MEIRKVTTNTDTHTHTDELWKHTAPLEYTMTINHVRDQVHQTYHTYLEFKTREKNKKKKNNNRQRENRNGTKRGAQ